MASQIVGVLAASTQGVDPETLQNGAWVANNATQYNFDFHMPPGLTEYGQAATGWPENKSVPFFVKSINKLFVNNSKANYDQLIKHINKADIVPLYYKNLTLDNQKLVNSWIEGLPAASKDKILIMR